MVTPRSIARRLAWLFGWISAAAFTWAGPNETAIVAMMRLSDQPNYSWVAAITDDARSYDVHGRTVRDDLTWVKMPVVNSLRRQLGRSVTDTDVEFIFRGNVDCVIATDEGWRTPAELPSAPQRPVDRTGAAGAPVNRRGVRSSILRFPTAGAENPEPRAYSNLQLGVSHPHAELAVIVSSHETMLVEGDVISGTLSDLGAKLLLVRDGQPSIDPVRASGSYKVWLRNGVVAKYQVVVEGTLTIQLSSGAKLVNVRQVTDTIVKDVGTTSFDVPPDARARLRSQTSR